MRSRRKHEQTRTGAHVEEPVAAPQLGNLKDAVAQLEKAAAVSERFDVLDVPVPILRRWLVTRPGRARPARSEMLRDFGAPPTGRAGGEG
jgi:hypothetical protein